MGYLLAKFFFEGGSLVWIPEIGIRESGDVTFYAGRAFALPDDGQAAEAGEVEGVQGADQATRQAASSTPNWTMTPALVQGPGIHTTG
jgi:hypothetical protein